MDYTNCIADAIGRDRKCLFLMDSTGENGSNLRKKVKIW